MMKDNQLEFIDQKPTLCSGDAQARYLTWKIKKVKNGTTLLTHNR